MSETTIEPGTVVAYEARGKKRLAYYEGRTPAGGGHVVRDKADDATTARVVQSVWVLVAWEQVA